MTLVNMDVHTTIIVSTCLGILVCLCFNLRLTSPVIHSSQALARVIFQSQYQLLLVLPTNHCKISSTTPSLLQPPQPPKPHSRKPKRQLMSQIRAAPN